MEKIIIFASFNDARIVERDSGVQPPNNGGCRKNRGKGLTPEAESDFVKEPRGRSTGFCFLESNREFPL